MQYVTGGRYHIIYLLLEKKVFIDFHFDNTIHGIGMGADYGKKPEEYFTVHLKRELDSLNISY